MIQWVRQQQSDDDYDAPLDYVIALVRGMAHRLEHGGGGTDDDDDDDDDMTTARRSSSYLTFARHLLVPRDCQLAVYHPTNTIANDAPNDEPPDDTNGKEHFQTC